MANWTDGLRRGEHCIHVYADEQEMLKAVLDLTHWLGKEEKMVYFSDVGTMEGLAKKAGAGKQALRQLVSEGRLESGPSFDTYCPERKFRGAEMVRLWRQECQKALDNGFKGVIAVGDVTWLANEKRMFATFMNYEMSLNLNEYPLDLTILCEYDRRRFSEEEIDQATAVHQTMLNRGVMTRNFFLVANVRASGSMFSGLSGVVKTGL